MDVIRIEGGKPLSGSVKVGGAKNAALPIFAAALLTPEPCIIDNVPDLSDIRFMADILRHLGATVEQLSAHRWQIIAREIDFLAPYDLVRRMRASVCLLGPLTGRLRRAEVSLPGGCVIGHRPIDLHIKGLRRLGCDVVIDNGYVKVDATHIRGDYLFLGGRQGPTVTGTANLLMAAVLAPGITRIESAACEPEIVDLCEMLVKMGARIEGIGSHYLKITGVEALHGCQHSVVPDRIEAGTLLIAGAITRSAITVEGAVHGHMRALIDAMEQAGLETRCDPSGQRISTIPSDRAIQPTEVITLPHPGFPTDIQAQWLALMCRSNGLSILTERIYPNRFMHVPELLRMGADVSLEGANAIVKGVAFLSGAAVMASDLRASAALVLAGLAARGTTWVQRIYHLDRGYEHLERKLAALGADIQRMDVSAMPSDLRHE